MPVRRRSIDDVTTVTGPDIGAGRRWAMLAASTVAQASTAVMVHGPAFLIPVLHEREGLTVES